MIKDDLKMIQRILCSELYIFQQLRAIYGDGAVENVILLLELYFHCLSRK